MFHICLSHFLGFLWPDSKRFHTFHSLWGLGREENQDGKKDTKYVPKLRLNKVRREMNFFGTSLAMFSLL